MEQNFGVVGDALYSTWEHRFKEISKEVKFGGADADVAYLPLMNEINNEINKRNAKSDNWKTIGIVMVFICIGFALATGAFLGKPGVVLFFVSIAVTVFAFKMKASNDNVIYAAFAFDEKYLGGEIFYHRRNG